MLFRLGPGVPTWSSLLHFSQSSDVRFIDEVQIFQLWQSSGRNRKKYLHSILVQNHLDFQKFLLGPWNLVLEYVELTAFQMSGGNSFKMLWILRHQKTNKQIIATLTMQCKPSLKKYIIIFTIPYFYLNSIWKGNWGKEVLGLLPRLRTI